MNEKTLTQLHLEKLVARLAEGARLELRQKLPAVMVVWVEGQECLSIPLTNDMVAIIDFEDAEKILPHCWCARKCSGGINWYAERGRKKGEIWASRQVKMHRFLKHGAMVDHKNGNTLDNRKSNLRHASYSQNMANARLSRLSTTGAKGVTFKHGKWCARITAFGKRIELGYFKTLEDASEAYRKAANRIWGEFARY